MSYYGKTLFPVVESVFHEGSVRDLPRDPKVAAEKIRSAGYPAEAAYIENLSAKDLCSVYEYSGLVSSQDENEGWAMAETEWSGR